MVSIWDRIKGLIEVAKTMPEGLREMWRYFIGGGK